VPVGESSNRLQGHGWADAANQQVMGLGIKIQWKSTRHAPDQL